MRAETTFRTDVADAATQRVVRAAIADISAENEPGGWPIPVEHVEILGTLGGGRSGALVLDAVVHSGGLKLRHVVKVAEHMAIAAEWEAYQKHVHAVVTARFSPIVAVSSSVLGPQDGRVAHHGALVYRHVSDHLGEPGEDCRSFEDVVREAVFDINDVSSVVPLVSKLFNGLSPLHDRADVGRSAPTFRALNKTLGPSLTLEVDRFAGGALVYESPGGAEVDHDAGSGVLEFTCDGSWEKAAEGALVPLRRVKVKETAPLLVVEGQDFTAAVRMFVRHDLAVGQEVGVLGKVVGVRGVDRVHALREAFGSRLSETTGLWSVDGVLVGDPFAELQNALTSHRRTRPLRLTHGDLNAANVLVVGDALCVTDYDKSGPGLVESDFAWLEINLVRNVMARLGFVPLVRVERAVALASVLLSECDGDHAEQVVLPLLEGRLAEVAAFRVLFSVRRKLFERQPPEESTTWWRDYLAILLISAHRTLKWSQEMQTPDRLRSTAAVASVAGEWLNDGLSPFEHWPETDRVVARAAMMSLRQIRSDATVHLVTQLFGRTMTDAEAHELGRMVTASRGRFTDSLHGILGLTPRSPLERFVIEVNPDHEDTSAEHLPSRPLPAVETLAFERFAVVTGGSPDETAWVAEQVAHRLAVDAVGGTGDRLPLMTRVADLARLLAAGPTTAQLLAKLAGEPWTTVAALAATVGVFHLIVTDAGPEDAAARPACDQWIAGAAAEYPRMRILVCRSGSSVVPPGARELLLAPLDEADAREALRRAFGNHFHDDHEVAWMLTALDRPPWAGISWCAPHMLEPLVSHVKATGSLPALPGLLLARTSKPMLSDSDFDNAALLAEHLVDAGVSAAPLSAIPISAAIVDRLREIGLVELRHGLVAFCDPVNTELYAAAALIRRIKEAPDSPPTKSWERWDGPLGVVAALDVVTSEVVESLVTVLGATHPGQAARVLAGAGPECRKLAEDFGKTLHWMARSTDVHEAVVGVRALGLLGRADRLAEIAEDTVLAEDVRAVALETLVAAARGFRRLTAVVRQLIGEDSGTKLKVTALRAAAETRLAEFAGLAQAQIEPGSAWEVVRQAGETTVALGRPLDSARVAHYAAACADRLEAVVTALRKQTSLAAVQVLTEERFSLLTTLAEMGEVHHILRSRFDFDLGLEVGRVVDSVTQGSADDAIRSVLTGPGHPGRWLELAKSGEPDLAFAAAHRLLGEVPESAAALLRNVRADSAPHRLLIAAGAAEHDLATAEALLEALAATGEGQDLERVAALVAAIAAADRQRGVRAAWRAARALTMRNVPERHRWPWIAVLASWRGTPVEWDSMLAVEEDVVTAVEALSTSRFTTDAGARPHHEYSAAAKLNLLAAEPVPGADPSELVRWVNAAATVGLVDALPAVRNIVSGGCLAGTAVWRSSAQDSLVRQSAQTEALAALGYLARLRYETCGEDPEIDRAYHVLLDQRGGDAVYGRAIGLAYLGDFGPLLEAMPVPDRFRKAPVNALVLWSPGPYRPQGVRPGEAPADWLARRARATGAAHLYELLAVMRPSEA